jgi:hypothetical protein
MVVVSPKGKADKPTLCQSETDILTYFGTPSASYPSLFEAIAYTRKAPCYVISALGTGALYGGVIVSASGCANLTSGVADISNYTFEDATKSHALFASSQCDSDLYVNLTSKGGTKFNAKLYQLVGTSYIYLKEYNYSLAREKDGFGASLYYDDIFDEDTYIIPFVNETTSVTTYAISGSSKYNLDGGSRGTTPNSANITTAWSYFQSANKYPVATFMDVFGDHAGDINNLIQTYQVYAQGISCIPYGNSVSQAVVYRNSLSIDSDDVGLYYEWTKIKDPYNNSQAWISNIGSVGKKFAAMSDVYDSYSPAGVDENGKYGGQLSDWTPIAIERDLTDLDAGLGSDLQTLDEAQINPIIFDESYGLMIYGDKTLQVSLSDTSYVGTRRLYKLLIKNISRQVLRRQEFKNIDSYHMFKAKSLTEELLRPIVAGQYLRSASVVCSDVNNTDATKNQRQFILDVYVQATPNSQKCILKFTRLSQTMILSDLIKQ